jgi:gamma-glutamyltranspeptidase/glutathione hydrolase
MTPAVRSSKLDRQSCYGARSDRQRDFGGAGTSTAFPAATDAASQMLRAGGNAVDAAVAAAWTLSVCEPSASGLGGQSTLLIYRPNGVTLIIDGHSCAPSGVSIDAVNERQQRLGHRACTVPSTPATLEYAQRKYGLLPQSAVFEPAIQAAEEGYAITALQHRQAGWFGRQMQVSSGIAKLFLVNGAPPPVGYLLRQPELARTLRRLAKESAEDFYRGEIAQQIVDDMQRNGGLLNAKDLVNCSRSLPVEREPLETSYRALRVVSAPSPGGGRNLLFALKLLEQLLPGGIDAASDESWHEAIALATYCAFRQRERKASRSKGCADAADELPSEADIQQLVEQLSRQSSLPQMSDDEGPGDTTHLNVADSQGNVVALTQSIQSVFGAKVAHPELGFVYNNYLWTCPRYAHPNQLAPGCMPRSNAAPTIVVEQREGQCRPVMAVGAAGSRRITSALLQTISQVIDRGLPIDEAIAAPRLHGLISGKVWIEEDIATPETLARLRKRFSEIQVKRSRTFGMGCVQGLQWLPDGTIMATADPRRDGTGVVLNDTSEMEIA